MNPVVWRVTVDKLEMLERQQYLIPFQISSSHTHDVGVKTSLSLASAVAVDYLSEKAAKTGIDMDAS